MSKIKTSKDGKWKCSMCKEYKTPDNYYNNKNTTNKLDPQCKECRKTYYSTEKMNKYFIKSKYGMTVEEYDILSEKQGGVCAICGKPEPDQKRSRLCIDHDHETGKVRGLLCSQCNFALGNFNDDISSLLKAAEYLTNNQNAL